MESRSTRGRRSHEDGISEVVGFVVILAVVVGVLSLYLTYAIPVQGREEEIRVMDGVRSWFVDYKTGLDQLWLNSPVVNNSTTPYVPRDTIFPEDRNALYSITTGQVTLRRVISPGTSRESGFIRRYLPLLAPIPSSAEVSVRNEDTFRISGWRNGTEVLKWEGTVPSLVYTSHNYYWLQQEYSYQLGGVFLRQWDLAGAEPRRMTVVASPPLSLYTPEGGTTYQTKAEIVVVNLSAETGGFGVTSPVRVETNLSADPLDLEPSDGRPSAEFSAVTLTFEGASHESAVAWSTIFEGAAMRNTLNSDYYNLTKPNASTPTIAAIDITGYEPSDPYIHDVQFEALIANYAMRMQNVPTMIE